MKTASHQLSSAVKEFIHVRMLTKSERQAVKLIPERVPPLERCVRENTSATSEELDSSVSKLPPTQQAFHICHVCIQVSQVVSDQGNLDHTHVCGCPHSDCKESTNLRGFCFVLFCFSWIGFRVWRL